MADNDKKDQIMEVFRKVITSLSERGQERLLSYGEGMLAAIQTQDAGEKPENHTA